MVQKVSSSCTPLVHVPCWRLSCLWIVLCTPLWRPLSEKVGLSAETWPEEIQCFQTEADEETELFPNENTVSGTLPTGALASSSDELRWGEAASLCPGRTCGSPGPDHWAKWTCRVEAAGLPTSVSWAVDHKQYIVSIHWPRGNTQFWLLELKGEFCSFSLVIFIWWVHLLLDPTLSSLSWTNLTP